MRPWKRLFSFLDEKFSGSKGLIEVNQRINRELAGMSAREKKPVEELIGIMISRGLEKRKTKEAMLELWQALSSREMEVAAFTCLGLSRHEVGQRLKMSDETVKTHMNHIFRKFKISNRDQLRSALQEWDFSEWQNFRYIRGLGRGKPKW